MRMVAIVFIVLIQVISTAYIIKNTDNHLFTSVLIIIAIGYIAYVTIKKIIPKKEIIDCFEKFSTQIQKTMKNTKLLNASIQDHKKRFTDFKKRLDDIGLNGDDEVPDEYVEEFKKFENEVEKFKKEQEELKKTTLNIELAANYYKDGIEKTIFKAIISPSWSVECHTQ